jgi:hypothetical protein
VRVAGPRVHRGPHSGRRPELTRARPSCRSGARWLATETQEERGWRRDPSGGLTSGGGAARRASSGAEQSSAAVLGVRGTRGEEVKRGERG